MRETLRKELSAKIIGLLFILLSVLWFYLTIFHEPDSFWHHLFTITYGVVALLGGVVGIKISKKWGGFKSVMGKAILFFSFGLLAQEFGQVSYIYYIYFQGIEVPYPSLGDLGYFGSIPLYTYGAYLLAKASGTNISLRSFKNKIIALALPLLLLGASYYFFLQGYEFSETPLLTVLLDFGYPFGQAIYVSVALLAYLLSRKILGGIMKKRILFILFALVVQYFCDLIFLYQVSRETWHVSGINDYMYLFSYYLMSIGLIQLKTTADNLNGRGKDTH